MNLCVSLAAAAAVLLATACNTPQAPSGTIPDTTRQHTPGLPGNDAVSTRVTAIADLERALGDSTRLAALLGLPLPETALTVYVENDAFTAAYEKAGRQLTPELFTSFYPDIAASLQLSEFRELFRRIPPEAFSTKDSSHAEVRSPKEACYQYYIAHRQGNQIMFEYGSDHNDAYSSPEDADTEVCEFATIWTFRIEGSRLRFVSMFQAG